MIFILASITDGIDGSLARKHDIVTNFGKLIDPIADKLLVCSALIMLMTRPELFKVSAIVIIILIGREFIISGFRLLAASKGKVVAADRLGKIKMVVQIVAICFVLVEGGIVEEGLLVQWNMPSSWPIIGTMLAGQILMWASAILAVASLMSYFVKNKEVLKTLF